MLTETATEGKLFHAMIIIPSRSKGDDSAHAGSNLIGIFLYGRVQHLTFTAPEH
jgi:hypothetical protein